MKKRLVAMLYIGVMVGTILVGCGSSEEESGAEAQVDAYDSSALDNVEEITLTMMVSGTATENDFETEILPALVKEKWPNVTLEVTKLPDDNYYTSLKTKLASGEAPDIFLTQTMYAGVNATYTLAEAGYLASLDDLDSMELMGDMAGFTYDDNIYAAASGVSILGTYYNKDIFAEAGVNEVPQTWDEFLEVCEKIKTAGYQPIVMGDKDQYVIQFGLYQLASSQIYAENPDYPQQLRLGETSFTDEGTWDQVLDMYGELYEKGYIDASHSLGTSASQAITEFIDGNAAMTFDGSFNASAIQAEGVAGNFERGYFPLPGETTTYAAVSKSSGFAVYSESDNLNEAKALLDYWFNGESEIWEAYIATGKVIPTYGNGADSFPNYELFAPFIELSNEGKGTHWSNQAWPAGTETVMLELFSEMVGGQGTTVEDITKGMQDKFEDLLED